MADALALTLEDATSATTSEQLMEKLPIEKT